MAGIGFELKKMFNTNSILVSMGGYFYATFISVGPIIVMVLFLLFLRYVMRAFGADINEQNLFLSGVMYAFMGAMLVSSFMTNSLSRYLSDMIYTEENEKILPACFGATGFVVILSAIIGIIFYIGSPVPFDFKLLTYLIFIELSVLMILMIFISALKEYKRISFAFVYGFISAVITVVVMYFFTNAGIVTSLLLSLCVFFFVAICLIFNNIYGFFKYNDRSYFSFIKQFFDTKELAFISFFYMFSIYVHNIIIWQTDIGFEVAETFLSSPMYDVPSFIALLSILPSTVLFVVKTETTFYDRYREYIKMISGGGTLVDLNIAREDVKEVMYSEFIYLMEIQLMITVFVILISKIFFPLFGLSNESFGFFGYLAIGYLCISGTQVLSSFLLYFDARKESFILITFFLVTHVIFVTITTQIGIQTYGLGTLISGFLSLVLGILLLRRMMGTLDYRLYCSQPINTD